MGTGDWIALASAAVSVGAVVVSTAQARRAERASEQANRIAVGEAERSLRDSIDSARQRLDAIVFRFTELKMRGSQDANAEVLELLRTQCASAVEAVLNAYETACGQFIDGKVDRERFKKTYHSEIRQLCDPKNEAYASLMHPQATSHFQATWKVYQQWYNLEHS